MMKITETTIQAVLMRYVMSNNHIFVVPNSTVIYPWESDLISVTKSLYAHEYEIKISLADYRRDSQKWMKHRRLEGQFGNYGSTPNYFWYVTFGFDIEPPEYAGWMSVHYNERATNYHVDVKKPAPRLCKQKISNDKVAQVAKLLSWRLANIYKQYIELQPLLVESA